MLAYFVKMKPPVQVHRARADHVLLVCRLPSADRGIILERNSRTLTDSLSLALKIPQTTTVVSENIYPC